MTPKDHMGGSVPGFAPTYTVQQAVDVPESARVLPCTETLGGRSGVRDDAERVDMEGRMVRFCFFMTVSSSDDTSVLGGTPSHQIPHWDTPSSAAGAQ
jgi:hypothetical protein